MNLFLVAAIVLAGGFILTSFVDFPDVVEDFIQGLTLTAVVILCLIGAFQ